MSALTYRSPLEETFSSFTSIEQSQIAACAVSKYKDLENENFQIANYALKPQTKQKLFDSGIYLSPHSGVPHSHPVCKTLENYLLYKVLPSYVNNSFYFVGIKKSKIDFLKKRNSSLNLIECINRYVTSRDKSRYGNDFVRVSTTEECFASKGRGKLKSESLYTLLPEVIKEKSRSLFLHDEIHYWSKDDLLEFLNAVRPKVLLCTMVFPPEILAGSQESLNKWCYDFVIKGKELQFFPDGVKTEGYYQPLSGGMLLKSKRIYLSDGTVYCVDLLHSKFAHHLIAITEGDLKPESKRTFGNFDAVAMGKLGLVAKDIGNAIPVSQNTILRVYRYLRSLQKPDMQSAMAKLSQISPYANGFETRFMQEFSKFVIETKDMASTIMPNGMKSFCLGMLSKLPKFIGLYFKCYKEFSLDQFITELKEFYFTVELDDINKWYKFKLPKLDFMMDEEEIINYVDLDDEFSGEANYLRKTVHSYSYATGDKLIGGVYAMEFNEDRFSRSMSDYVVNVALVANYLPIDRAYARECIASVLSSCRMSFCVYFICRPGWQKKVFYRAERRLLRCLRVYAQIEGCRAWFKASWGRRGLTKFLNYGGDAHLCCVSCAIADAGNELREMRSHMLTELVSCYDKKLQKNIDDLGYIWGKLQQAKLSIIAPHFAVDDMMDLGSDELSVGETEALSKASFYIDDMLEMRHFSAADEEVLVEENICCSCGLEIGITLKPIKTQIPYSFPDQLKNRECGWYSEEGLVYSYTGGTHKSIGWPQWCKDLLQECGASAEGYNSVLVQRYRENASIGFHSDDEGIFVKNAPILTVCTKGLCIFKVQGKSKGGCSGNCIFRDGSFFTMPKGFQESHKHAIEMCSEGRISLTFRKTIKCVRASGSDQDVSEDDFFGEELFGVTVKGTEKKVLSQFRSLDVKADGNCFWHSFGYHIGLNGSELKGIVRARALKEMAGESELLSQLEGNTFAERESLAYAAMLYKVCLHIVYDALGLVVTFEPVDFKSSFYISLANNHYTPLLPTNDCVPSSIAKALSRPVSDVHKVLSRKEHDELYQELCEGEGLHPVVLEEIFSIFGISARVQWDGESFEYNSKGQIAACFSIEDNHMEFLEKRSLVGSKITKRSDIESFSSGALAVLGKAGVRIPYVPSYERAERLAGSLYEGTTGSVSSRLFDGAIDQRTKLRASDEEFGITAVLGTFGAGKSTLFKEFFRRNAGKHIAFVSPRKGLAEDMKDALFTNGVSQRSKKRRDSRTRNWNVFTFETFIKKVGMLKAGQVVIIDEIQLYPPGYLDLVLRLSDPSILVYVVGDPCQSDYDSEKDRNVFFGVKPDFEVLLENVEYPFNIMSLRFTNSIYDGRLPCLINEKRAVIKEPYNLCTTFEEVDGCGQDFASIFLVSSFEEKRIIFAHYTDKALCMTFGESTGRTFKKGTIVVTSISSKTSDQRWVTALSRFSENLCILNLLDVPFNQLLYLYDDRVLAKFLTQKAGPSDLKKLLPGKPVFTKDFGAKIGKDQGLREEKMQGDPWLKGMVGLYQKEEMQAIEMETEFMAEGHFKTHLPIYELESIRAAWLDRLILKEERERWIKNVVTNQFADDHSKNKGVKLTNAAQRFESIYPRHRNSDTATFLMAVRKRLSFSNPSREMANLRDAMPFGESMLKLFLKFVPMTAQHEEDLANDALEDFFDKKTSKSSATIANHSGRSCRDWLHDVGLVFMKSQHCTKFEKRFCEAKAAQSIVCFQHEVLCRFAPCMRYIEKKMMKVLPKRFYVHSGKGLDELNAWVKDSDFSGLCTESDYEAFDASQDEYIMAFELCLMEYLGISKDIIKDYVYIKTHLGSKLGNFAIMRFSGEASTFLFNTMANILFTCMKYDLTGKESICFAGDDMCASRPLRVQTTYQGFLDKLKLKAKVCVTKTPTFCGWNLSEIGIFKKPQLVFERMCIARENNNLAQCIDNYAIEVSYAYKLGELATCKMDEEELVNHYQCVRTIIKNKKLIKSNILEVFENSNN